MKKFEITKHYNYAEIFTIEAADEKDAIKILEDDSSIDPDQVYEQFDFYDVVEQLDKVKENEK